MEVSWKQYAQDQIFHFGIYIPNLSQNSWVTKDIEGEIVFLPPCPTLTASWRRQMLSSSLMSCYVSLIDTASMESLRSPISPHKPEGQHLEQDIQKVLWEQKYKERIQNWMLCDPGVFLEPRNYKIDFHSAYF